jgi:signal transduction histidine kinase
MPGELRLLIVEDSESDTQLAVRELERAGFDVQHLRVETEAALRAALDDGAWDLVISDYNVPGFGGTAALSIVREMQKDLPVVFVSGTIGEETAVIAMRAGANDYVMKSNLKRLVPAIERELREAAARAERGGLEEQVRQAQKMEAVGRLAGGVAHDFNNVLTAILGYSELIRLRTAGDEILTRHVTEVEKAATRAAGLTSQLLAFSRKQVLQARVLDLNAVVAEIESMLRRIVGESIEFRILPVPDLGRVRADRGQIEQVIVNLVVNAGDAMPNGGTVTIETANFQAEKAHALLSPGRYVVLSVSDTGTGMDAETQGQIFEPFFTTKAIGRGTGLGLSTVHGIVKQSGGQIEVQSEPGKGAKFRIYLPEVEAPLEAGHAVAVTPASAGAGGTILFVEDDSAVRDVLCEALRMDGYRVLEAVDRTEAVYVCDQCDREGIHVSLMLSDLVMPGISAGELFRRVTAHNPGVRVLYMSGYTDQTAAHQAMLDSGGEFLQKPFTVGVMLSKVHDLLGGAAVTS